MMCQACEEGRHWDCGLQSWCDCDCDPEVALYNYENGLFPDTQPEDYEQEPEQDD